MRIIHDGHPHIPFLHPNSPAGAQRRRSSPNTKKYLLALGDQHFQQPLVADRGEMQHLWDLDGNRYSISSAAS